MLHATIHHNCVLSVGAFVLHQLGVQACVCFGAAHVWSPANMSCVCARACVCVCVCVREGGGGGV